MFGRFSRSCSEQDECCYCLRRQRSSQQRTVWTFVSEKQIQVKSVCGGELCGRDRVLFELKGKVLSMLPHFLAVHDTRTGVVLK